MPTTASATATACPATNTCLCTLPPNPHAYTNLSLYAVSVVPKCPSCSGPCINRIQNQNGAYSFRCGDTDPFFRTLWLATVLVGSCSPDVCTNPLHTELVRLRTDLAFDGTAVESTIEQKTTYVYSAVDRWTNRAGVQPGTAFLRMGLRPFALGGLGRQVMDRLANGGTCSATSATDADAIRDRVVLDRFLFQVYQQLRVVRQHLDIAAEVTQMNANALRYAGGGGVGRVLSDEDVASRRYSWNTSVLSHVPGTGSHRSSTSDSAALAAVQTHLHLLTHLQTEYQALCTDADTWLDGCTNSTSCTMPPLATISSQWIPIARQLVCLAEHISREEFRTLSGIDTSAKEHAMIDVLHDPILEQQMRALAIAHVRFCADQHLDTTLTYIQDTFFGGCSEATCGGGCEYACSPLVECMLKDCVRGLWRWVGLGDGVRWVGG